MDYQYIIQYRGAPYGNNEIGHIVSATSDAAEHTSAWKALGPQARLDHTAYVIADGAKYALSDSNCPLPALDALAAVDMRRIQARTAIAKATGGAS